MRHLFEINGKTCAYFPQWEKGLFSIVYRPKIAQLFYGDKGEIKTKFIDPGVSGSKEQMRIAGKEGYEPWFDMYPPKLYTIFKHIFACDNINTPFPLLGYAGKAASKEFNDMIENRKPNIPVDLEYSISELQKRRNIIPYKPDLWYEAWIFQKTHPDPKVCFSRLEENHRLNDLTADLLTEYNIPYEYWDMDKADYSVFGLEKPLPKHILHQDQCLQFQLAPKDVIYERVKNYTSSREIQ